MSTKDLARAIFDAATLHEDSYVAGRVGHEGDYEISIHDASVQTGGEYARPVELLLELQWNDAIDWAGEILGEKLYDDPET